MLDQNAFAKLGLAIDADEAAVKAAYARLLKENRPDDDPERFQALREAYQSALGRARRRDEPFDGEAMQGGDAADDVPAHARAIDGAHRAEPQQHPVPPPQPFDMDAFFRELVEHGRPFAWRAEQLDKWLRADERLYRVELKQAVAMELLRRFSLDPSLLPVSSNVLGRFFDVDFSHVAQRAEVDAAIAHGRTGAFGEQDRAIIRRLKPPFSRPACLLAACVPGFAIRANRLRLRLTQAYGARPPGLDPAGCEFFARLSQPTWLGASRWLVASLRAVVAGSFLGLLGWLLALSADAAPPWQQPLACFPAGIAASFVALAIHAAWNALEGWHDRRLATGLPDWRPHLVLALASLAVFGGCLAGRESRWPYALALAACVLAARRWTRIMESLRFAIGSYGLGHAVMSGRFESLAPPGTGSLALAAILVVGIDGLFARRKRIPARFAAGNPWTRAASFWILFAGVVGALAP